jgi:short-subunit dehydrogenase involved in D-alanine esterification of teichoic acids
MKGFENQNVLISVGNSGIGLASVLAFSKEGARVIITGRDQATLDKATAQLEENGLRQCRSRDTGVRRVGDS